MFGDFSSHNVDGFGPINVAEYAHGRPGALHRRPRWISRKVSEGHSYKWDDGDELAAAAHRAGLHVIHYHWLRADQNAASQATFFARCLSAATVAPGDLAMIDFEDGHGTPTAAGLAADLSIFARGARAALPGVPLILYTGNWYVDKFGPPVVEAVRRFPVVLSDYSHRRPLNPHRFRVVAHQFTDRQAFAGVKRPDNDANRWLSSPAKLFGF